MTARVSIPFPPRLMGEPQAAAYLGVSATTLRGLGLSRVQLGARRLYDRLDLDAYADGLPRDGESAEGNSCDSVWGKAQ